MLNDDKYILWFMYFLGGLCIWKKIPGLQTRYYSLYCEKKYIVVYKYWLLMREIVQNNSPMWLEMVGYYISRDKVKGNIGTWSPVNKGSYFAQFPD